MIKIKNWLKKYKIWLLIYIFNIILFQFVLFFYVLIIHIILNVIYAIKTIYKIR